VGWKGTIASRPQPAQVAENIGLGLPYEPPRAMSSEPPRESLRTARQEGHRRGSLNCRSAKNSCSLAVKRNSPLQSAHVSVLSVIVGIKRLLLVRPQGFVLAVVDEKE